jgi:hypothetical protein
VSEPIYSRAPDVVWRLGPDRVLVRRIGVGVETSASDLMGSAALLWIALDEPGTAGHLRERLQDDQGLELLRTAHVEEVLIEMSAEGLVDRDS